MIDKKEFENIKDYVTKTFLQDENDLSDFDIYDEVVSRLAAGDLDDYLVSKGSNKSSLELAHEYQGLCFYDGSSSNWLDSVEGPAKETDRSAAYRVVQNFDFLQQLAEKDGGKDILEQLTKFQDYNSYADSSVIECLRNTFANDALLENVLSQMSDSSSRYQIFTDEQKADLLLYPEGTVYYYGENGPTLTQPSLLSIEIHNRMDVEKPIPLQEHSEEENIALELASFFRQAPEFHNVACDMSLEYHEFLRKMTGKSVTNVVEAQRDLRGTVPNVGWSIDDNELAQMLGTPYQPIVSDVEKKQK